MLFQNRRTGIAVGSTLLKAVIFLHGLVIEILAVYDKENLINKIELRSQSCSLEAGQGLTTAGSMPDKTASGYVAVFLVVMRNLYAVQDTFRCRNLIRTHNHQHLF